MLRTVGMQMSRGRAMRRMRFFSGPRRPRRCQSRAQKKPLSRKNTGMRKPCTSWTRWK